MIYDYNHFNNPKTIGNKNVYAYGDYKYIKSAGFIHADNKAQAQQVLKANNKAWQADCILLDFTKEEILSELERRENKQKTMEV